MSLLVYHNGLTFHSEMGEGLNSEKTSGARIKLWKKPFQIYFSLLLTKRDGWQRHGR